MKAFIFDMDDTLYDLAESFKNAYADCFARESKIPAEDLYIAFRKHGDEVFEDSENGRISMKAMYIYRIRQAFEDFGITLSDDQALAFQKSYAGYQNYIEMSDEMIKLFDFLAYHGFFTAVLSNGGSAHQWDKVRALGLKRWVPKQNIIISGDAGYMKPDIRIFRYAEEHLNLTPAQIWFTGDSIKNDVYGSEAAGWHTIFFNRRKKAIPEDVHPDLIVENEYTLSEQIRRIAIIPSDMK